MITNAKMTHYSKDIVDHVETWTKHTFDAVMWQDKIIVNQSTGYRDMSEVDVYIPYIADFIKKEDVIVRGIQTATKPDELKTKYYTVTSVNNCDYGSSNMQHTELVGK